MHALRGCVEGSSLRGAHVGEGCALVLRADATTAERLVAPHYLHVPSAPDAKILGNVLGMRHDEVRVESFTVDLRAGDVLLLASEDLPLPDAEIVRLARAWRERRDPFARLAEDIEERLEQLDARRPVCFALARAR